MRPAGERKLEHGPGGCYVPSEKHDLKSSEVGLMGCMGSHVLLSDQWLQKRDGMLVPAESYRGKGCHQSPWAWTNPSTRRRAARIRHVQGCPQQPVEPCLWILLLGRPCGKVERVSAIENKRAFNSADYNILTKQGKTYRRSARVFGLSVLAAKGVGEAN